MNGDIPLFSSFFFTKRLEAGNRFILSCAPCSFGESSGRTKMYVSVPSVVSLWNSEIRRNFLFKSASEPAIEPAMKSAIKSGTICTNTVSSTLRHPVSLQSFSRVASCACQGRNRFFANWILPYCSAKNSKTTYSCCELWMWNNLSPLFLQAFDNGTSRIPKHQ